MQCIKGFKLIQGVFRKPQQNMPTQIIIYILVTKQFLLFFFKLVTGII